MESNSVCNHISDNKIGRPRSGSPICLSRVLLQTKLNDTKSEHKNSAIGKHFLEVHGNKHLLNEGHFKILRKCQSKFDCLIFEMLFIKKIKPCLNTQADSIRAKLFV